MKNQYFGDINDYKKYGLLRLLSRVTGLSVGVCFMLTHDDSSTDGSKIKYLKNPPAWAKYDPELFYHLVEKIEKNQRSVDSIRTMINGKLFTDFILPPKRARREYFESAANELSGHDLVFFDPDNGLGVKSVPYGSIKSNKFVYLHEIASFYEGGHSILIYQHYRRENRQTTRSNIAKDLFKTLPGAESISFFSTANVAFVFIPQQKAMGSLPNIYSSLKKQWHDRFEISSFDRAEVSEEVVIQRQPSLALM